MDPSLASSVETAIMVRIGRITPSPKIADRKARVVLRCENSAEWENRR
jgi:hypothetical protein